jgi:hypothetical protein
MQLPGPTAAFRAFSSTPLLSHFSFTADWVLHVDSLGFAIAGVLSQPDTMGKLHPVSFYSQKLTNQERSWPIYDLELFAVVTAFKEWRAWLAGTRNLVLVFSDHANLWYFMTSKSLSPKQGHWAVFMDSFNFKLLHLSGTSNPADGPSQRVDFLGSNPLFIPNSLSPHFYVNAVAVSSPPTLVHNLYFQPISFPLKQVLKERYALMTPEELSGFGFKEDVYWYQHWVLVPPSLRPFVIRSYHDQQQIGHPGIARTLSLLLPWSVVGMDMIVKLPVSSGFDTILVFIDLISKSTHFVPCKDSMHAKNLVQIFLQQIVLLHSFPNKLFSDRGMVFTSDHWQQFLRMSQVQSALSMAYHPQRDGQTERMNQILEDYLQHYVSYNQLDWSDNLDIAKFSLNNLHSSSSGVSPFFHSQFPPAFQHSHISIWPLFRG